MFKVAIKAINPSAKPRPYCGTSSLIPEYLAIGGDRSIQVTISIDSNQPYKAGKTTYEGDDKALMREWMPDQYGMRGKRVGDNASPADLHHALMAAAWLEWKIISGQEILDIAEQSLPPGAIA
jgi:hypothetical protein